MNSLKLETGGRPFANDDIITLQANILLLGLPALLNGMLPCIISGCRVSGNGPSYNVGSGMVWDGSQLLDFPGRGAVTLPLMFARGALTSVDERPYQTGGTKTCITGQSMELVPMVAGAPNLVLDTFGALTFRHRMQEQIRRVGEVNYVANLAAAEYDTDGLGLPGTAAWGWALCNGQNDTADLRGRFVAGFDPARADYDTVGKTGGEEAHMLSIAEMPAHTHGASSPNTNTNNNGNGRAYQQVDEQSTSDRNRRTSSTGGSQAHENRPPFYVLGVIQWVGFE